MDTSANTITNMGIISDEVYKSIYFENKPIDEIEPLVANGTTYKVINHTGDSTLSGLNALLLQDTTTGNYTIAFRGTESIMDWITNILSGASNVNLQYNAAVSFVNKMMSDYGISASQLTLTGHSLGGILTQQVGATLGIKGYAYNPWGADALAKYPPNGPLNVIARLLEAVGVYTSSAESFAKDNIVNISYNDAGSLNGDGLSNALTGLISNHLGGSLMPIVGENVGILDGHSMPNLNNAIAHYNEVLKHFTTDTTFNNLSAAYLSMKNYERTEQLFNDIGVYNTTGISFEFLQNASASAISSNAQTDPASLYSLVNLVPFVLRKDFAVYQTLDPDDYSENYLEDRADMLYYNIHQDIYAQTSKTYYEDIKLGSAYTLGDDLSNANDGTTITWEKKVIFGSDNSDAMIAGSTGDDHLYGMGGNDVLDGRGGDDYLEGGADFDTYISKKGVRAKLLTFGKIYLMNDKIQITIL